MSLNLLTSLFQMMDEDKQNLKLEKLLNNTLSFYKQINDSIFDLVFRNEIRVTISHQFDHYNLFISDPTFYEWGDTSSSQLSGDRVMHYLKQIGEYKYEQQDK